MEEAPTAHVVAIAERGSDNPIVECIPERYVYNLLSCRKTLDEFAADARFTHVLLNN